MRRIGSRIILMVLVCSIGMSVIVGGTSMFRSKNVIEKESKANLLSTSQIHSENFDQDLILYESIVENLSYWKGNPFLDKITPNKNIPSKYCLSC